MSLVKDTSLAHAWNLRPYRRARTAANRDASLVPMGAILSLSELWRVAKRIEEIQLL